MGNVFSSPPRGLDVRETKVGKFVISTVLDQTETQQASFLDEVYEISQSSCRYVFSERHTEGEGQFLDILLETHSFLLLPDVTVILTHISFY